MKITKLTAQIKNPERINVFGDDKYLFSLDIAQIAELGVRVGRDFTDDELQLLERESEFGKYYSKALIYALNRPRSVREVEMYLTKQTHTKVRFKDGIKKEYPGMSKSLTDRVLNKLIAKKYIDDEYFASYWVENRNLRKGISERKLRQELTAKGVSSATIEACLMKSERNDLTELGKIVNKKRRLYPDKDKFTKYLIGKGYNYSDIQEVLSDDPMDD